MWKMEYNDIIQKIQEKANIPSTEVEKKILEKMNQLSGLVSREGAAYIIANEFHINLFEQTQGSLKIKNVLSGMRSVETAGKVLFVSNAREFAKGERKGRVGHIMIGDETGSLRVVLWNEQCDLLSSLKENDCVRLTNAFVKDNMGQRELQLGQKGSLEINPAGLSIEAAPISAFAAPKTRKKIATIAEGERNVEVLGHIVQVFDPRFYDICPQCNKKISTQQGVGSCQVHGTVTPVAQPVLNVVLDDGTKTIRTVFFASAAQLVASLSREEMVALRDNPDGMNEHKEKMMGKMIAVTGRVSKNVMFERLELVANSVNPNPDPVQEIALVQQVNSS